MSEGLKKCVGCFLELPVDRFHGHNTTKDGLNPKCKSCRRNHSAARYVADPERFNNASHRYYEANREKVLARTSKNQRQAGAATRRKYRLKSDYGLTLEQYEEMVQTALGVWGGCNSSPSDGEKLFVDHDHATNVARGLLCRGCNTALGMFGDSIEILNSAIAYLERVLP